ncbi:MAG: desulfoferrodoxin [Candidatus Bathyarchaeota archaeon]|nr:desulfoferrodoxin [Candidatus Termiticorpusculum sp.]MCL2257764.1 desulfoferrodoxin [Candidatus Termiticorpusculum sp.]MCL2292091.1 desulfoferrodoxin [Candidatus Termiticorpusculum sp.]
MRDSQKFYICKHCGNIADLINNKHKPLVCCGEKMSELIPNTVEASIEKHLPLITKGLVADSISVQIGSILHPMENEHHISFVYVESERGGQCRYFKVGEEPKLVFCFSNDKPIAVYAYCNLHGLWKTEIK